MPKPIATLDQMIHSLRSNWPNWNDDGEYRDWNHRDTVSYTISTTAGSGMTETMANLARFAFEAWDDVIATDLVEGGGDITLAHHSENSSYTNTNEDWFGTELNDADIWISNGSPTYDDNTDYQFGTYAYFTYLHEIGHALGLTHPGDYNGGTPVFSDDALWAQDTRKYSVMSYFNADADGSGTDHRGGDGQRVYASTPLLYDIAAMHRIYGADMTTRTGDTTYGFNSNAGKTVNATYFDPYSFDARPDAVFCIWDAGGIDTIDARWFSNSQVIDLNAGAFSSIGALTDNVSIAFGATIENAIGGFGNDDIRGNAAHNRMSGGAGNDTLRGYAGNDSLSGNEGNDVLLGGEGADTLFGGAGRDELYGYSFDTSEEFSSWGDHLFGGEGDDYMSGGNGLDTLWGGDGFDIMLGGADLDDMHGEAGNDRLSGGDGDDKLYGGAGNDILEGGRGGDLLTGNGDAPDAPIVMMKAGVSTVADFLPDWDTATYENATSAVTINLTDLSQNTGDAQGDRFISIENFILTGFGDVFIGSGAGEAVSGGLGADILSADDGNDSLRGGNGDDRLFGGAGNDFLSGGYDNDRLDGDSGNDVLEGDDGLDTLNGGAGLDRISGGNSVDTINGGLDSDQIIGGAGADRLTGGSGRDTFIFNDTTDSYVDTSFITPINKFDRITDFNVAEDVIDLSLIDADMLTAETDDMFHFGSAPVVAPRGFELPDCTGLVWTQRADGTTTIYASTDADYTPEFQVALNGLFNVSEANFIL